jgi:AcrR family transcriptional regulator
MARQSTKTEKIKKGNGRETRRDGEETARAFIEVATRLFAEKGFNGTSIADIGKEMNLTTASLYYFMSGKQELLLRVLETGMAEFLDRLEEIAQKPIDPKSMLREAIENHLSFVLNNQQAVTVFLRERRFLTSRYKKQYQSRVDRYDELFTDVIKACIESGAIPADDPHLIRLAILGMINWVVEWYRPDGRLSGE